MFKKDLLGAEVENNKISTKILVSVDYIETYHVIGYSARYYHNDHQLGSIKPTSWEGHFIRDLFTNEEGVGQFMVDDDTTGITRSISITRLDTNKTISGEGEYVYSHAWTVYNLNGELFAVSDVGSLIEIEVWYKIDPKSN